MKRLDPLAPTLPGSQRARWPKAAGVAAAVLLLHVGVLGLLPAGPGAGWSTDTPRTQAPLQVRQLQRAPQVQTEAPTADASPAAAPSTAARQATAATPARTAPGAEAEPQPTVATVDAQPDAEEALAAPAALDATYGGVPPPVYATRLPAASTLRFEWRRGAQRAHAVLRWNPLGDSFELALSGEGPAAQTLGSNSRGHLAASGLAPERHTESRRGRETRAVNFQYDSARITFSGPGIEHPLLPGAQDRLSWLLQLAAIAEANPALHAPGSEISIFVAGSRGDADVWVFTVQGRDGIDVPAGPVVQPLHLLREPRRPYDTRVEVWLDPARGHLPVRLRQQLRPAGPGTEWLLESAAAP
jgi:Protein of unknown function (DUF3108)